MPDHAYAFALLPGFPRPESAGDHYEAEKAYVAAHGLPRPVLVDRAGVVWAGGTLLNVCQDLGIEPVVQVVENGLAAAIQELATRDLTVLEQADLVLAVYEDPGTKFVLGNYPKRSEAVSRWFKEVLGKARGFSPSQVDQYVRVARCPVERRRALAGATSLHQAMCMLKGLESEDQVGDRVADIDDRAVEPEPDLHETEAMDAAASFMASLGAVQGWSPQAKEILRGLRDEIDMILRSRKRRVIQEMN